MPPARRPVYPPLAKRARCGKDAGMDRLLGSLLTWGLALLLAVGCGREEIDSENQSIQARDPDRTAAERDEIRAESASSGRPPPLFTDATERAGIDFVRFDGRVPEENGRIAGGRRMQEWTGGGVIVFDYDLDGRPDLFFTQGCDWPLDAAKPPSSAPDPSAPRRGRLYRNVDGQRFEDVTERSGLLQTGFGQGAAAGDFNADGFPDLFLCHIGGNRLWRNEGDGTFT
ncbi:MAG: VCBS repeat-containing protein, partial [Planctomycetota bacterium]